MLLVRAQNFQKIHISYPMICTSTFAYQRLRNLNYLENVDTYEMDDPLWEPSAVM